MSKKTPLREIFAEVAKNLNEKGVQPIIARKWSASNVQAAIYRGRDIPALFVEFEKVKRENNR